MERMKYLIPVLLLVLFWLGEEGVQAQGTLTSSYQNLALGGGRLTVTINVSLLRWNELQIEVGPQDTAGDFRLLASGWTIIGISQDPMGHRLLMLRRERPGTGLETIMIDGPEGRGRLGRIVLLQNGSPTIIATSQPTFLSIELAPPGGGFSPLKRFDINNNDLIDDPEFFQIIDAWIAGQLDDRTFFQAIDLWVSQRRISSASTSVSGVELQATGRAVSFQFQAHGQGLTSLGVEVFNLSGERVFAQQTLGRQLVWNLSTNNGRPVANGIYLYVIKVKGYDGKVIRTEVRKLIVKR